MNYFRFPIDITVRRKTSKYYAFEGFSGNCAALVMAPLAGPKMLLLTLSATS